MSIETSSERYLRSLGELFKYLSRSSIVYSHASQSASIFARLYSTTQQAVSRFDRSVTLNIDPNLHFPIDPRLICSERGRADIFFGGEINFAGRRLKSQALVVTITFRPDANVAASAGIPAMQGGRNYVVRRFHFDFDSDLIDGDRPVHHLQYGGDFSDIHLNACPHSGDGFDYSLMREMDNPRLPIPPADPGSVLDTVLHQFGGSLQRIVVDEKWIELVSSIEKIWIKEYFEAALREINKATRQETLYKRFCKAV